MAPVFLMVLADTLLSMSRAELVSQASGLGVERADRLTRPELRDEILRRTKSGAEAAEARGLFGIARSMLASMMETGLKMPDAAALIRGTQTLTAQVTTGTPVATVTLAEIYAAQGHPDRALTIVDRVLATEPDHAAALRLRERLGAESATVQGGLAVRAAQTPSVLETTGEEIRTGEPPPVELVPEPESTELGPEPDFSQEKSPPELFNVSRSLGLDVRGSQLVIKWELTRQAGLSEGGFGETRPVIRVVGFLGRPGRPGHLESQIPLSLNPGSETCSGSVHLDGYSGASVGAALGFVRGDQFVPLTQTVLGRKAWETALSFEEGESVSSEREKEA